MQIAKSIELNSAELPTDDLPDARTCPNIQHLFPEKVRRPLRNLVDGICPRKELKRRLKAVDFQVLYYLTVQLWSALIPKSTGYLIHCFLFQMGNSDHMKLLKEMGITIMALDDGRVQLVHAFGNVSVVSCPAGVLEFFILNL